MLPRIPVDVIHAPLQIVFVTNRMLPITFVPHATLPMFLSRRRLRELRAASHEPSFRELLFDSHPSQWIPAIATWQGPDRVPMVGKKYNRYDLERMISTHRLDRLSETPPAQRAGQNRAALVRHARKKEGPARNIQPAIVRHPHASKQARRVGQAAAAPAHHLLCVSLGRLLVGRRPPRRRPCPTLRPQKRAGSV
jgi:hypothetical protein